MLLLVIQQVAAGFFAGIGGYLFDKTKGKILGPDAMPCKICGGECKNPMGVCRRCQSEHIKTLDHKGG